MAFGSDIPVMHMICAGTRIAVALIPNNNLQDQFVLLLPGFHSVSQLTARGAPDLGLHAADYY